MTLSTSALLSVSGRNRGTAAHWRSSRLLCPAVYHHVTSEDVAPESEAGYCWLEMSLLPLKSQGKSSLRLSKPHACERIVLGFGSKQAVFCLVALKPNEKGHRETNWLGLHTRNSEDFFRRADRHLGGIQFCLPKTKELVPNVGNWGSALGTQACRFCSSHRDGVVASSVCSSVVLGFTFTLLSTCL